MTDGNRSGKKVPDQLTLNFGWTRRLPMFLQAQTTECGLACLAMLAYYYGHDVDLAGLRSRYAVSLKGQSLAQLMKLANRLDFTARPLRLAPQQLTSLKIPCVLHWDLNHFVVLKALTHKEAIIHDPAQGVRRFKLAELDRHFTGIALELIPTAEFHPIEAKRQVSLHALIGRVQGLIPAAMQILLLALALEIFGLIGPFFLQWVIDMVLVSADHSLLTLLGLGFLGIAMFGSLFTALRSWIVSWLGATLNVQWSSNLFAHLMRLPLDWFGKRHVGDVLSRFASIQAIQRTLTTQFVGSLLDGLMSIVTLLVMGFYSLKLTLLVIGLFLVYGLTRLIWFDPLRRANEEKIVQGARQQSEFLESIRGILPIKLANKGEERLARYANATVSATNRDIAIQRLTISFTLFNQLLFSVGRVVLVWIAAKLALDNSFSAGMLVAFIAYADQFTQRVTGLIDKAMELRMLKLHTERVADIALTTPEPHAECAWLGGVPPAYIELVDIGFRYAEDEPWIFRNLDLKVEAGESVAIVGPSGCGKSTLAKIVLGLLSPEEGEVRFGGVPLQRLGLDHYRCWLGAVMQDDQLFAGSFADNISFFDPEATMEQIVQAAQLAAVHDDIMAMPMNYQSLVGDMGTAISGGQKQRVILARALYRQPRLLVLDEATSHLDVLRERQINTAIQQMSITRIVIAHRPETIKMADRIITIGPASAAAADTSILGT